MAQIGDGTVVYDDMLAARIRALVGDTPELTEQKMFGGLAFLVGGNMAVAASSDGGLMIRVNPAESAGLIASSNARPFEMRGRSMPGWLHVRGEDVQTDDDLRRWVTIGTSYARSLPAKR